MMSTSGGLKPRAVAGRPSVTKLTQSCQRREEEEEEEEEETKEEGKEEEDEKDGD